MTELKNADDLRTFLVSQSQSGGKAWFGFPQQRIVSIYMCYELAKLHANTMTPNEVVEYAIELCQAARLEMSMNADEVKDLTQAKQTLKKFML